MRSRTLNWTFPTERGQKVRHKIRPVSTLLATISLFLTVPIYLFVECEPFKDASSKFRIVNTKYGSLRGQQVVFAKSSFPPVDIFLGIPYASPPIGKLRFMPPVTPASWTEVRDAMQPGPVCPQILPDISDERKALQRMTKRRYEIIKRLLPSLQNQSEDCLYLNIYTPSLASTEIGNSKKSEALPVIMVIHGESYEWNAGSSYNGTLLASLAKIIVVTINYRLGILGFYPALDGSSRGNFGLMDQVAALHWIQQNIAEFGGDPSNVTVLGQDYGAILVNLLMFSPMSKGLFHRSIMQSGSALSPFALSENTLKYGRDFASSIGCYKKGFKNSQIVECLRQKSVHQFLSIQIAIPRFLTGFGPFVDGIVIPSDPQAMVHDSTSYFSNYDMIVGINGHESELFFSQNDFVKGVDSLRRDKIVRTLVRNIYSYHLQEIYSAICNEYTDWSVSTSSQLNSNVIDSVYNIVNDALFVAPIIRTAMSHSKSNKSTRTYSLVAGNSDLSQVLSEAIFLENLTLFPAGLFMSLFDQQDLHGQEFARSLHHNKGNILLDYFTNFIYSGDPNLDHGSETRKSKNRLGGFGKPLHWPVYDSEKQRYIFLNSTSTEVRHHYNAHRLSLWLNLIPKLHNAGSSILTEHNFLEDHDNMKLYEGIVRKFTPTESREGSSFLDAAFSNQSRTKNFLYQNSQHQSGSQNQSLRGFSGGPAISNQNARKINSQNSPNLGGNPDSIDGSDFLNGSFSMIVQENPYSTALSVTISVGCSLLVLNILVFAGIFLHKDKSSPDLRSTKTSYQIRNGCRTVGTSSNSSYNQCNRIRLKKSNSIGSCNHQCTLNDVPSERFMSCEMQNCGSTCSANMATIGPTLRCSCNIPECSFYVCDCSATTDLINKGTTVIDMKNELITDPSDRNIPTSSIAIDPA